MSRIKDTLNRSKDVNEGRKPKRSFHGNGEMAGDFQAAIPGSYEDSERFFFEEKVKVYTQMVDGEEMYVAVRKSDGAEMFLTEDDADEFISYG